MPFKVLHDYRVKVAGDFQYTRFAVIRNDGLHYFYFYLSFYNPQAESTGKSAPAGKCRGTHRALQTPSEGYLKMMLDMASAAVAVGDRQGFFSLWQAVAPVRCCLLQVKLRQDFSVFLHLNAAHIMCLVGGFYSIFQGFILFGDCFGDF